MSLGVESVENERLSCPICGKRVRAISNLIVHIYCTHVPELERNGYWTCPVCKECFSSLDGLKLHMANKKDLAHQAWVFVIARSNNRNKKSRGRRYQAFLRWIGLGGKQK